MISSFAQTFVAETGDVPDLQDLIAWVCIVRLTLARAARRRGCTIGDFASTLVCAISNARCTQTMHIGDGTIVARPSGHADYAVLSWPMHGEFVSQTHFITDPDIRLAVYRHDLPIDRLAVMSDGMERLALNFVDKAAHPAFFNGTFMPIAAAVRRGHDKALSNQLGAFLASPSVNARTDDDKTLVLAVLD